MQDIFIKNSSAALSQFETRLEVEVSQLRSAQVANSGTPNPPNLIDP